MVAIVGGNSLGLSLTSLAVLGQHGLLGGAANGRSGENVFVNAANGNLVIQDQDDQLIGHGPGAMALRTYNSQGLLNDDNADNWSNGFFIQPLRLTGTRNTAGSTLVRTDRDGAEAVYTYDATTSSYVSSDGAGAFDTIVYDAVADQYVWTDGDTNLQERYDGDASARLRTRTDTAGNTTTFGYTGALLSSVSTASGETLHFDYSGSNLTQVRTVDINGVTLTRTRYDYDTENRLWHVITDLSPDDNTVADDHTYTTTYTYEGGSERVHTLTQTDGTSLTFGYVQVNGQWRIQTVTDALGHTTGFDYNGAETTITDALGNATVMRFDTLGRLIEIQAPSAGTQELATSFAYNANGDVSQIVDGRGNAVHMEYDARGNQLLQRDAAGNTVTRTYDERNHLLTETVYLVPDSDGAGSAQPALPQTTRYVYDSVAGGRLRFVITPEGRVTEHRYNAYGERTSTIGYPQAIYPTGALTPADVPSLSALTTWVEGQDLGLTTRVDMGYDDRGQLRTTTSYLHIDENGVGLQDADASTVTCVYDRAGLLLSKTLPRDDETTTFTYDGLGRVLTQTDALQQVTVYLYDDANGRTEVELANGLVKTSTYDHAGRLTAVIEGARSAASPSETRYFYDAANRLAMTQDPTGVRQWMLYDDAGRKVADIDGDGTLTEYSYNAGSLLTRTVTYAVAVDLAALVLPSGQPALPTLDAIRPPGGPDAPENLRSWNLYDDAGRLAKSVDIRGSVRVYEYDGAGRLTLERQMPTPLSVEQKNALGAAPEPSAIAITLYSEPQPTTGINITLYPDYYREVRSFYSADGLLIGTLDAEQYFTHHEYDAAGRLIATTRYAHRMQGQLADGLTPPVVIANGASAPQGAYIERSAPNDPEGDDQVTRAFYNTRGQLAAEVDAENYLTEYAYDVNGNRTASVRYATALTTSLTSATRLGDWIVQTSANDRTTTSTYDELGRLSTSTNHEGTQTRYQYDQVGNLTATTLADGTQDARTLRSRYDAQGRLVEELSAEGSALITGGMTEAQIDAIWDLHAVTHTYDAAGRRSSTTDQNGHATLFYYDTDGRLACTINSLGEVEYHHYNTLGLLDMERRLGTPINMAGLSGGLATTAIQDAVFTLFRDDLDSRTLTRYVESAGDVRFTFRSTSEFGLQIGVYTQTNYGQLELKAEIVDTETGLTRHEFYTYDKRGLETRVDVTNYTWTLTSHTLFSYDAFGRVVRTEADGRPSQQKYDRLGRVVETVDASDARRFTSYDAFGRVLTQTDALGHTTEYVYDDVARSVTMTTAEGVSVTTVHDRLGQVISVTDARQNTTTYEYDRDGRLRFTRTPLTETENRYDRAGLLEETVDAKGNVVAYTYDAANRVLSVVRDPGGLALTTNHRYDAKGQAVWTQDPNGTWTHTEYDLRGLTASVTVDPRRGPDWVEGAVDDNPDGLALTTTYTYDSLGQQLSVTSPEGTVTRYEYDILGRRTSETIDPDGLNITTSYTYDERGNVVSVLDDNGNRTRFAYDASDRVVYSVDGAGGITHTDYDDEGRITRVTRYANAVPAVALNALPVEATAQAIAALVSPSAGRDAVDARRYDDDGRLSFSVDGTGAVVQYLYDGNGNITDRVAYVNRIDLASWDIETDPQVMAAAGRDAHSRMSYDALNRCTFVTDGVGAVTQNLYDDNGNVSQRIQYATRRSTFSDPVEAWAQSTAVASHPGNRVTRYDHDAANRLIWQTDANGSAVETDYDDNGNVLQRRAYATQASPGTLRDGVAPSQDDRVTNFGYDAAGRLVQSVDAEGFVTTVRYDEQARSVTTTRFYNPQPGSGAAPTPNPAEDRVTTVYHDRAGRVSSSVDALGFTESFTYDGLGHKLSFTNQKGSTWNYTYDAAGRLQTETSPLVALTTLGQEADGDLTGGTTSEVRLVTRLTYDGLGQLVSRTEAEGRAEEERTTHYEYDAVGHQVRVRYPRVDVYRDEGAALAANGQSGLAAASVDANVELHSETVYDALGNAVANIDVAGNASYKLYDAAGRVTHTIDAMGYVTGYGLNAFGEVETLTRYSASTTLAEGPVTATTLARTASDVMAALGTDRSGDRQIQTQYDTLGRAVRVVEPAVFTYDSSSSAHRYDTQGGKVTRSTYNAFGDLVAQSVLKNREDDTWATTTYHFDRNGRNVAEVNAEGYLTRRAYDALGNLRFVHEYAGPVAKPTPVSWQQLPVNPTLRPGEDRLTEYAYDRGNRKTAEIRHGVTFHTTAQVANAQGELVPQVFEHLHQSVSTTYGYDAVGNLTRTTDAQGASTYSYYDALGRVTAVAAPSRSSTPNGQALIPIVEFRRDAHGNVVLQIDRAQGAATADEGSYGTVAPSGDDRQTYKRYDRHGHAVQTTDATGYSQYSSYNARGELAKTWQGVTSGALQYGSDGRLIADSTSFTVYQYDKLGRLTHTLTPAPRGSAQVGVGRASFVSSAYEPVYEERHEDVYVVGGSFIGYNSVTLGWRSLVDAGGGTVRIEVSYQTAPNVDSNIASRTINRPPADFSASQVLDGTTLSWYDNASVEGGISALHSVHVRQQAADGSWTTLWQGTPAQANGNSIVLAPQASAGVADTVMAYNAFGEMTRKGVVDGTATSGRQEYFDYDNAGRLWRTNTGDGVDRVMLYDLQGHNTAIITSAGIGGDNFDLRPEANPDSVTVEQIALRSGLRRTDFVRDDLGRITRQIDPQHLVSSDGAIVQSLFLGIGTPSSSSPRYTSNDDSDTHPTYRLSWSGSNQVGVGWSDLSAYGSGQVRVTLRYQSLTYDRAGIERTYAQIFNSAEASTGATLSWRDADETIHGGIAAVLGVKVEKQDAEGRWVEVIAERSSTGNYGTAVGVFAAADGQAGSVKLYIRPAGSAASSWTQVGENFGDGIRFDFSTLSGDWDYEVRRTPPGLQNTAANTHYEVIASGDVNASAATVDGSASSPYVRPEAVLTLDRWGNTLSRTDVRDEAWVTRYTYNANNQVTQVTQPATDHNGSPSQTSYFYDALGRQVATRDARGNVNAQVFDAAGNLVSERHADGGVITHRYDAFGNKRSTTDAEDNTTDYAYDKLGRLLSTTQAMVHQHQSQIARAYDNDLILSVTEVGQRRLTDRNTYDQLGRKVTQTNGLGETIRYRHDMAGNIIETIDALGAERGYSTKSIYDRAGHKTAELDANGLLATWNYDYFGRLMSQKDLGDHTTHYNYDNAGQLTSQGSTRGQAIGYSYNLAGQQTSIYDAALLKGTTYAYDLAGNRIRERTVQYANQLVYQDNHMAYDAQGRLRDVYDGRMHVTIDYDAVGNRTRIRTVTGNPTNGAASQPEVSGSGTATTTTKRTDRYFLYDSMNRQTVVNAVDENGTRGHDEANPTHVVTYDKNGNRLSDTYWGNRVTLTTTTHYRVIVGYNSGDEGGGSGPAYMRTEEDNQILLVPVGDAHLVINDGQLVYDAGMATDPDSGASYRLLYPLEAVFTHTHSVAQDWVTDTYAYDGMDRLTSIAHNDRVVARNYYDGASRLVQSGMAADISNAYMELVNQAAASVANNPAPGTGLPNTFEQYLYDKAGRTTHQLTSSNVNRTHDGGSYAADPLSAIHAPGHRLNASRLTYDNVGNITRSEYEKFGGAQYVYQFNHTRFDGYKVSSVSGSADNGSRGKRWNPFTLLPFDDPFMEGLPFLQGDPTFDLLRFTGVGVNVGGFDGSIGTTTNVYDANGHLVAAQRSEGPSTDYVNDAQGRVLQATNYQMTQPEPGVNVRTNEQTQRSVLVNGEVLGAYGVQDGKPMSDMNFSFDAIHGNEGAMGRYTVRAGDTLQSIARLIYGDSSLWYRLADANGLAGDVPLTAGQVLNAPAQPGSVHNNANTYKSYNQGRILTDSTPPLGLPGQPCGGNGEMIVMVVSVIVIAVVTYFTAGTGTAAAAGVLEGAAVTVTPAMVAEAAATGAMIAGAGALAGQATAVAINLQKDINWKSVAVATIGGAIGGALIPVNIPGGPVVSGAVRAAISNAASQGVAIALGVQEKFDWRSVAASMASAAVGSLMPGGATGFAEKVAAGAARGFVTSLVRNAVKGGEIELAMIATDAFGNALGAALAAGSSAPQAQGDNPDRYRAENLARMGRLLNETPSETGGTIQAGVPQSSGSYDAVPPVISGGDAADARHALYGFERPEPTVVRKYIDSTGSPVTEYSSGVVTRGVTLPRLESRPLPSSPAETQVANSGANDGGIDWGMALGGGFYFPQPAMPDGPVRDRLWEKATNAASDRWEAAKGVIKANVLQPIEGALRGAAMAASADPNLAMAEGFGWAPSGTSQSIRNGVDSINVPGARYSNSVQEDAGDLSSAALLVTGAYGATRGLLVRGVAAESQLVGESLASFEVSSSRKTQAYGINYLREGRIRSLMDRTPAGRQVVEAADSGRIDLVFSSEINPPRGLFGEVPPTLGGTSPTAIVYLKNVQNGRSYDLLGIKSSGYDLAATTGTHEGLHALGVGGSRRAEALVRLEELRMLGAPIDRTAMRQVLTDMQGNYDHLPWLSGRTTPNFPNLKF